MEESKGFLRELLPHAVWRAIEWMGERIIGAVAGASVIALAVALVTWLKSHVDIVSISVGFIVSLLVLIWNGRSKKRERAMPAPDTARAPDKQRKIPEAPANPLQPEVDRLRETITWREATISQQERELTRLREELGARDHDLQRARSELSARPPWMGGIATDDNERIESRICYIFERMAAEAHLESIEPYVDLKFALFNLSVYELALDRLEGKLTYGPHGGAPLERKPEIPEKGFRMPHAFNGELVLRQWVSAGAARQILDSGDTVLGTGSFALWFSYQNVLGEQKTVRKAFPDQMFRIRFQDAIPLDAPRIVPVRYRELNPSARTEVGLFVINEGEQSAYEISIAPFLVDGWTVNFAGTSRLAKGDEIGLRMIISKGHNTTTDLYWVFMQWQTREVDAGSFLGSTDGTVEFAITYRDHIEENWYQSTCKVGLNIEHGAVRGLDVKYLSQKRIAKPIEPHLTA